MLEPFPALLIEGRLRRHPEGGARRGVPAAAACNRSARDPARQALRPGCEELAARIRRQMPAVVGRRASALEATHTTSTAASSMGAFNMGRGPVGLAHDNARGAVGFGRAVGGTAASGISVIVPSPLVGEGSSGLPRAISG